MSREFPGEVLVTYGCVNPTTLKRYVAAHLL